MSSEVFSRADTVLFVHGLASTNAAGGCTVDYILANGGFKDFDLSLIMDANGDPKYTSTGATYNDSDGWITAASPGDFDGCQAGMILYAADSVPPSFTWGKYEILDTDIANDKIQIISGLGAPTGQFNVYVGGAHSSIDYTLANSTADDAAGAHNCFIFTNKNETPTSELTVAGGGSVEYNTKFVVVGFNTTLLDMFPGGAYYQNVRKGFEDGIDANCHVTIDCNNSGTIFLR